MRAAHGVQYISDDEEKVMLRMCKIGHGARIPNVGDKFLLQIGWYLGRPLFPPACITQNGECFRVHYSVRSVSSLLRFQIGQVWEVEVVRLRRRVRNGKILTIARIDLHTYRDALMGYFDYSTKMWRLCQQTAQGFIKIAEESANVRYSEFVRANVEESGVSYEVGLFPEVLDNKGNVLIRYSPRKVRKIDACECVHYIALPHDDVPLAYETDVGKLQKLVWE